MEEKLIDPKDVKTDYAKPEDVKPEEMKQMTSEEIKELLQYRSQYLNQIYNTYKDFVEAIYKVPMHIVYRQHAFLNIDQGLHWAEKGIHNLQLPPKKEEAQPEPTLESKQEPTQEPEKELVNPIEN